jgi:hypothetical protein
MNVRKVTGSSENLVAAFFRPDQEHLTSTKKEKPKSSEKGITIYQSTQYHITEDNSTWFDNKVREILEGLFIMNLYQLDKRSTKFTICKY